MNSMLADALLGTSVLLYAISKVPAKAATAQAANHLIATVNFGLSVQVCQEFCVAVTLKITQRITPDDAVCFLRLLAQRPLVTLTAELMFRAVDLHRQHRILHWDAAVIAAAEELEASTVYTEALNHGQETDSVTFVDPFLGIPSSRQAAP
jgi:predicted nucleic acid-binding protein